MKPTTIGMIMVGCVSCAPIVRELKKPPFPCALTHHSRVVGLNLSYQGYGIRLGFVSETITLIPCSTNQIYAGAVSDRFKLGQSGIDTTITEELNSGWKDTPPPPMLRLSQSPHDQPAHAISFTNTDKIIRPSPIYPKGKSE